MPYPGSMSRRVLPGLLLCLLAVAGWWVWGAAESGADGQEGTNAATDPSAITPAESISLLSQEAGDFAAESEHALQRTRLDSNADQNALDAPAVIGTVRWMDAQPAAGVAVLLLEEDTGVTLQTTHTDAEGRYRLEVPAEFDHQELDLYQVLCPGYAGEEGYYTTMPQVPADVVDIQIHAGFPLTVYATYHHDGRSAQGIFLTAWEETIGALEIEAITDADGLATLTLPLEGPWNLFATIGGFTGPDTSSFSIHWIDAQTGKIQLQVAPPSDALSIQAIDATTGAPLHAATFRPARAPDDLREIDPLGLATLPSPWLARNGRLDLEFEKPGRAFVAVEAEGYQSEVVEWIGNDGATHEVPLLPLRSVPVRVTLHGEPTEAIVTTAVNQRSLVLPSGEFFEQIAARAYSGRMRAQATDASGQVALLLPDPQAPGAPGAFDLWMEVEGKKRYFGTLSWSRMPEPPWHFEMTPPSGEIVLEVKDTDGRPLSGLAFHVAATLLEGQFDSIREGQFGRQSVILQTDTRGRAATSLPAPAEIHIAGSQRGSTGSFAWDGHLDVDETLRVPLTLQRPTPGRDLVRTQGRVEFQGEDWTPGGRELYLQLQSIDNTSRHPAKPYSETFSTNRDREFDFWAPAGRYVLWPADDTLDTAEAAGRTLTFEAGAEDLVLRLPAPYSLKIRVIDARTLEGVIVDDVTARRLDGEAIPFDSWEGDFAVAHNLFEDEVEVLVDVEGYAPAYAIVPLQSGIFNQHTIAVTPCRNLPVQVVPNRPVGIDLHLEWIDVPHARRPHVFHFGNSLWDAPNGKAHLRAYLDGQPLHDIHLDEESTEIVIDLGASQYFPPEDG